MTTADATGHEGLIHSLLITAGVPRRRLGWDGAEAWWPEEKGKHFAPDARMKKILTDAVAIANAAARSIAWYPRVDGTMKGIGIYPGKNSAWMMGWVDRNGFFTGANGMSLNYQQTTMSP